MFGLTHPCVVATLGFWLAEDGQTCVYITELCAGGDLLDLLLECADECAGLHESTAHAHIRVRARSRARQARGHRAARPRRL